MRFAKYFLLLPTFLVISTKNINFDGKTKLIDCVRDFVTMLGHRFRVNSNALCWDKRSVLGLTKALMRAKIMTTPSRGNLTAYWPHENQVFLVDLNCRSAEDVLTRASDLKLLRYPFHWILIGDGNPLKAGLQIFVRSKIYLLQKIGNQEFKITSNYRLSGDHFAYIVDDVAVWINGSFCYYNELVDSRSRGDLRGITLNVTHVILDKSTDLANVNEKKVEPFTKLNMVLSYHALEAINAKARLIPRTTWGYQYPNSTLFEGMMGDMQNETSDLAATPIYCVASRLQYIDPIESTTPTRVKFVFRALPLSYVRNVYVLPFHRSVWIASLGLALIVAVVLYTISYWEKNDVAFNRYEESCNSMNRTEPQVLEILQIEIGVLAQQGSESEPISRSGRITTILLFLSFATLYTAYSANIVTLLQSTSDGIKTLEDLLHSNLQLGVEDTPYNRFFITRSTGDVQRAIYDKKIKPVEQNIFMGINEGVERMHTEYFAFHSEGNNIYRVVSDTFLEHEKCGLTEIEYFGMFEPYYCIRKNSSYGEIIKNALRKMKERGIVHRNFNWFYLKKPPCLGQGTNFLSVSLIDCYAAFVVFACGTALSALILLLEKFYYRNVARKILRLR